MKQDIKELKTIFIATIALFLYSVKRYYIKGCEVDREFLTQCHFDPMSVLFTYLIYLLTIISVIILIIKIIFILKKKK